MNPFEIPTNIQTVYELHRAKVSGGVLSVAHAGVGFKDYWGNILVLHRTPDNNTHISSYEEYSAGQEVTAKAVTDKDIEEIRNRAKAIYNKGSNYSVFNNCEHLTNFVLYGRAESEQLKAALIGLGLSGLLALSLKGQSPWLRASIVIAGTLGAAHYAKSKKLA